MATIKTMEQERQKLHDYITAYGMNHNRTIEQSRKVDRLVNEAQAEQRTEIEQA